MTINTKDYLFPVRRGTLDINWKGRLTINFVIDITNDKLRFLSFGDEISNETKIIDTPLKYMLIEENEIDEYCLKSFIF